MDVIPVEVFFIGGYLAVAALPSIAITAWEGWTGSRMDSEEWVGVFIFSVIWGAVLPVAVLVIVVAVAGRVIRTASRLAKVFLKSSEAPHDQ